MSEDLKCSKGNITLHSVFKHILKTEIVNCEFNATLRHLSHFWLLRVSNQIRNQQRRLVALMSSCRGNLIISTNCVIRVLFSFLWYTWARKQTNKQTKHSDELLSSCAFHKGNFFIQDLFSEFGKIELFGT